MNNLKKITVIGMGLLGASITLAVKRTFTGSKTLGYSHRKSTREKARQMGVADIVYDDLAESVSDSDLVILSTPICTFRDMFIEIAPFLKQGCIVTDVGSTKTLPHEWARETLPKVVQYVGSHPIAGSEKRGVEYARDDLFFGAKCIVTKVGSTDEQSLNLLAKFWTKLGSQVIVMTPRRHDRIFGRVSHLPHLLAVALVNASSPEDLVYAGKGFIDTSRIASGPANVWSDIFVTNPDHSVKGIDRIIAELRKLQGAIQSGKSKRIELLLKKANDRRADLIAYKIKNRELI